MVIRLVRSGLLMLLALISTVVSAAPNVSASVDKNPVYANEPFLLSVTIDDSAEQNAFSAADLLRKGFVVGNTSVNSRTQIINGKTSRQTEWTTSLLVRQPGQYTVPAFSVAGGKSQPFTLTVVASDQPSPTAPTPPGAEVELSCELGDAKLYPKQQTLMRCALLLSAELNRGTIDEPQIEGAEVKGIGQDKESELIRNGLRLRKIERNYVIVPTRSGELSITGPVFVGEVIVGDRRGRRFAMPARASAGAFKLQVDPIPANYHGEWLPSELVNLNDEWSATDLTVEVGQPITRTLTLSVAGVGDTLLPSLAADYPEGVKLYPDKTDSGTHVRDDLLIGQRVERSAIIFPAPGQYRIPAVEIPWWDTRNNKQQIARVPEVVITVTAAANAPAQASTPATMAPSEQSASGPSYWLTLPWLLSLLLAFAIGYGVAHTRNKGKNNDLQRPKPLNHRQGVGSLAGLKQLAKSATPTQLEHGFKQWLRSQGFRHSGQLLHHYPDQRLAEAINNLYHAQRHHGSYTNQRLIDALERVIANQAGSEQGLHPQHSTHEGLR